MLVAGGAAVLVLVVVVVVVVVSAGGGSSPSSDTTAATAAGATTSSTSGTSHSSTTSAPPILSVLPSALSGACQQVASSALDKGATEGVACQTSSIAGAGADVVTYERFSSTSALSAAYASVLSQNQLQQDQGDCSRLSLTGSAASGAYCEGSYTDKDGNQGRQLLFAGSDFNVAGTPASQLCRGSSSPGATILLAASPSDLISTAAVACSSDGSAAATIEQDLVAGNYGLND